MILGAGVTGLAAGMATGLPVYEAKSSAGGICASYYLDGYRFEVGGGHWIFGDPKPVTDLVPCHTYARKASVKLNPGYIPYPLQANLDRLDPLTARMARQELERSITDTAGTMKEWMLKRFGSTLCRLFFDDFNEKYTAGLYGKIASQDTYKTPAHGQGYNPTFVYPDGGLDKLVTAMAAKCDVRYGKKVVDIFITGKKVKFEDGTEEHYDQLISTLPLNTMLDLCGLIAGYCDPHTSVIVLNIGAERGTRCPEDHWVYCPVSKSGFHRVGFYSNVADDFAPKGKVGLYVEKAFYDVHNAVDYADRAVAELQHWGYIGDVDVVDVSVVDVAYTWTWPSSNWRDTAIAGLHSYGIHQMGRYGRWHFQGIAESITEGLRCKSLVFQA
jgi:protoporphyrinogen oxidase